MGYLYSVFLKNLGRNILSFGLVFPCFFLLLGDESFRTKIRRWASRTKVKVVSIGISVSAKVQNEHCGSQKLQPSLIGLEGPCRDL